MRIRDPKTTALIFASGKMICSIYSCNLHKKKLLFYYTDYCWYDELFFRTNDTTLLLHSVPNRERGSGRVKSDSLTLDPMRAGSKDQNPDPTLGPTGPGPARGQCSHLALGLL